MNRVSASEQACTGEAASLQQICQLDGLRFFGVIKMRPDGIREPLTVGRDLLNAARAAASRSLPVHDTPGSAPDTARASTENQETRASERGLRIDHCESCRGYLKTYDCEGNEALLLSDWSSLHLDLIAHDRGLKRLAASLYEFEPVTSA